MGRTLDEALQHAMEAASEWAQSIPAPRPRLLEALRDDPDVKAALADGAVLAVVPFESGKPGRGEYLAYRRHAGSDLTACGDRSVSAGTKSAAAREPPRAGNIRQAWSYLVFVISSARLSSDGPAAGPFEPGSVP